jgi:ATP-dependent Clp protease ATP-binding subunit ClpC
VFEQFTEQARQVIVLAQDEARALKHNYIGTEHLLLGLLREQEGLAARVLGSLGVRLEAVRAQVVGIVGEGDAVTTGQIPFTPRAKKVLELALREKLSLGHEDIDTEHILLGLAREDGGVAAQILRGLDAGPDKIFERVGQQLSQPVSLEARPREARASADVESRRRVEQRLLLTGWLLFALALGVGILVGWAIWGH